MKYLFINSVAGFGSTGRLAAEKCRELMAQGHQCCLAYGRDKANCDDVPTLRIGSAWDYRIHGLHSRLLDDQGFGSRRATRRFLDWVREYDPDVIWLHNIHGYYLNIPLLFSYLKTCGKTIYWTLHDCWSFTGHCAYFDYVGCDRWKSGCHHCPQKKTYPASLLLDASRKNWETKRALFTDIPNMTLITPSQWLAGRVKDSFLGKYPVQVAYNTINREIFKPTPSEFRQRHGLLEKKIILGVASVWEERKGLRDFLALATMLPENYRILLVGLTPEQQKALPKTIMALPRTNSMEELAQIYSAADVYVSPSVEETFGMTAMEARACGTEAIVYKDTACEEVVNQFGGIAVERGPENLLKAILDLEEAV